MREIKFRGWSENGEWVYGALLGTNKIIGDVVEWNSEYFNTEFWSLVDENSVGQYTGFKDKNGTEIYEGDILACKFDKQLAAMIGWNQVGVIGKVYWDHSGFGVKARNAEDDIRYPEFVYLNLDESEVIGNIYEHPELLGDGE